MASMATDMAVVLFVGSRACSFNWNEFVSSHHLLFALVIDVAANSIIINYQQLIHVQSRVKYRTTNCLIATIYIAEKYVTMQNYLKEIH